MTDASPTFTAFLGDRLLASGRRLDVAMAVKAAAGPGSTAALIIEDETGRETDFDLRGTQDEVAARLAEPAPSPSDGPPTRGRPRLGVVAREVTLMPRHWDWLAAQPGGASVTLRRLVEHARRADQASSRGAREAAYRAMASLAGNREGFEEAARALFAGDRGRFAALVETWPADIRGYVTRLAFAGAD